MHFEQSTKHILRIKITKAVDRFCVGCSITGTQPKEE